MRHASIGAFCTLLLFTILTCSQPNKTTDSAADRYELMVPPVPAQAIKLEEVHEPLVITEKKENLEPTREEMINDIVTVWEMFFEDASVKQSDSRRNNFEEFAGYVADAVITYQNTPVLIQGDSAKLPKHRSVHIMMAVLITKESSVTHDVVGAAPRFEVGLMQVWGVALNGYNPDTVKKNPKLGVMLGVRWMTYMLSQCKMHRMRGDEESWRNTDWLRPLTMYGAKPSSVWKSRKDKTCRVFPHAKDRVALSQMYTERIDGEKAIDLQL